MCFRTRKLCLSHFLIAAKQKYVLLSNLPYVVIYLVNSGKLHKSTF